MAISKERSTKMKLSKHIKSVYRVIPPFVRSMAKQMLKKKNLKKTHWSKASNSCLMERITTKAHSAIQATTLTPKAARLICVDIANIAMLIHDNLKNSRG